MKILVTGSTGLLGANIVRVLVEQGKDVRVLVRKSSNLRAIDGLEVEKSYGDITDYESTLKAVQGCDYVYHVAADTSLRGSREQSFLVNYDGAVNVAKAVLATGAKKMVYVGSASIVGWGTMEKPADENTEFNIDFMRGNCYVDSKMAGEKEILRMYKEEGLPVVLTYPTLMYGAYDGKPSSGALIRITKYFPWFYAGGGGNIINARNAAVAHVLAMEKGRVGEKYIIGDTNLSTKDMVTKINHVLGRRPPIMQTPKFVLIALCWMLDKLSYLTGIDFKLNADLGRFAYLTHYLSPEKARRELGIPTGSPDEAIRDEVRYLQEIKYI